MIAKLHCLQIFVIVIEDFQYNSRENGTKVTFERYKGCLIHLIRSYVCTGWIFLLFLTKTSIYSMKYVLTVFCVFIYTMLPLCGQTISVITRNPMPSSLAEWQKDRSLIQVIIVNQAGMEAKPNCFLGYVLKDASSGRILAQSDNTNPSIPRFSLPAGPSTVTRFGNQVIHENSSQFDASIRTQVLTTNTIPEGSYDFCVTLFDERGNAIGELGTLCRFFSVTIPDPPTLLAPQYEQVIDKVLLPVFSWTPVITTSINSLYYAIKICPVFEGQNDRFAIDNNPVLHENKRITSTTYMYPPSGLQFSTFAGAVGFVWQVQALQGNGIPATRNYGKSEIYRFTLKERVKSVENNGNIGVGRDNSRRPDRTDIYRQNDDKDTNSNSSGTSYTTVKIGEHIVTLTTPQRCSNYCIINGQAKGLTPFDSDSLLFTLQALEVRNINNQLIAVKGRIVHDWRKKAFAFKAVTLMPKSIIISPIGNMIEGSISIDWAATGLRGFSAAIPYSAQWDDKGSLKTSTVIQKKFTPDNREDNCINLQCDTLFTSLVFSQKISLSAMLSGSLNNECTLDGIPMKLGSITLPLDEPNPENLLFVLSNSTHQISIQGTPIQLSPKEIWVDFSSDVNFSGVNAQPECIASKATNPLWKGLVLPQSRVDFTIGDKSISFTANDILLESTSQLRVSFMAATLIQQKASVGDYIVNIDSAYISLCNNSPIEVRFPSSVLLHESGYVIPSNWLIFKKLPLSLYFDGAWKLYGHGSLENAHLEFGDFSRLSLSTVVLRKQQNQFVLDFISNKVRYSPQVNTGIRFPDFSLSKGSVSLRGAQWIRLPQKYSTLCESFSVTIDEVGLGYDNEQFWIGLSGIFIPSEESGLSPFPLHNLKFYEDANRKIRSSPSVVNINIGGGIRTDLSLMFSYISDIKAYGVTGQGTVELAWLPQRKIMSSFIFSVKESLQYWHLSGNDLQEKGAMFLQDCEIPLLSFSAGWNTTVAENKGNELRTILHSGGTFPLYSNYKVSEHPLYAKGLLLLHDPSHAAYSALLHYDYSLSTTSGMFGALVNASGHLVWYPSIGFASGEISTQWSAHQKSREITLTGIVALMVPENTETSSKITLSQSASMKASIGPFDGIIQGLNSSSKTNEIVSLLECSQSYWEISSSSISLRGRHMSFAGISGIPEEQIKPISLVHIATGSQLCTDMKFEHNDNTITLSMRYGSNNATQYASFDVLPCLQSLGLLTYKSVQQSLSLSNKKIVFTSESEQSDCRTKTFLSVTGTMSAATTLQLKGDIQNITVTVADKSFSMPGVKKPVKEISGFIDGTYLQKRLQYTSGLVIPMRCEEKQSEYRNSEKNNLDYNIAASVEAEGYVLNRGKTLPKGTRLLFEIAFNENGRVNKKMYPIKLQSTMKQNDKISLSMLFPKETFNEVIKLSVRFVSINEVDVSDNCASTTKELCE